MTKPELERRRSAFESRFFPAADEGLRKQLRDQEDSARFVRLLIGDDESEDAQLLDALESLDIGVDLLAALALFPLASVAWADGRVDARERRVVLDAAHHVGIERAQASHRMLESWLSRSPDAGMLEAWKAYVTDIAQRLDDDRSASLKRHIFALCEQVAEATGDFLALDKISSSEYAVMRDLRAAFDRELKADEL
jgi:hypothetical protein